MLTDGSPRGVGMDREKLEAALRLVASWVEDGTVAGAVALVARRGRIAATWAGGRLSRDADASPVTLETPFPVASITKVAVATALLREMDAAGLGLDTEVTTILTEWSVPGAERITLRHLLSHTSGLPEDLPRGTLRYEDQNPLSLIVDTFMRVEPVCAPGERLIYSNVGFGILARVLERLSGTSYREAIWKGVFGPLWMNDTWLGSPSADRSESVAIIEGTSRPGTDLDEYNGSYWRSLGHPWGGMFSTATDLARLAQVYLDNGKPLLTAGTALTAVRNGTNGLRGGFSSWVTFPSGDWGAGWEIKGGRGKHWTGDRTSYTTFGHIGGAGSMFWADPLLDLVCVALANRTLGRGWSWAAPKRRWQAFSEAVVGAVEE